MAAEPIIEELPFMQARLRLIDPSINKSPVDAKRASDPTVAPVLKRHILLDSLPMIRSETLRCCEAVEGKGGNVGLKVCDRIKFDNLQKSIKGQLEEIAALENAIRELDGIHAGWLDTLRSTRDSLAATEGQQKQVLAREASIALQRNAGRGKSPEDILAADQLYQAAKVRCETQISQAKRDLEKVAPEISKIESILSSVGC